MKLNDMHPIDLKLKLLAGDSLSVGNIVIHPFTLREIKDVGYSLYHQYLNILVAQVDDLIDTKAEGTPDDITIYDVILYSRNEEIIGLFVDALSFFLREEKVTFVEKVGLVFGSADNLKVVGKDNIGEISDLIRYQNLLKNASSEFKPVDDEARQIAEKMQKTRKVVEQKKSSNGEDNEIDIIDIISAVSTKSNTYNKHNIWDCTFYQIMDEYKRLEAISGYETSVLAIINGAKIDLKHWSAKLDR